MNVYEYVILLKSKLQQTMEIVAENLNAAQKQNQKYYDMKTRQRAIRVGDRVLLLIPKKINKLVLHWKGPYQVVDFTDQV